MLTLKDKVIFITGASRGIGREIALRAAQDGAKIVIASKTTDPHRASICGQHLPALEHAFRI